MQRGSVRLLRAICSPWPFFPHLLFRQAHAPQVQCHHLPKQTSGTPTTSLAPLHGITRGESSLRAVQTHPSVTHFAGIEELTAGGPEYVHGRSQLAAPINTCRSGGFVRPASIG